MKNYIRFNHNVHKENPQRALRKNLVRSVQGFVPFVVKKNSVHPHDIIAHETRGVYFYSSLVENQQVENLLLHADLFRFTDNCQSQKNKDPGVSVHPNYNEIFTGWDYLRPFNIPVTEISAGGFMEMFGFICKERTTNEKSIAINDYFWIKLLI